VPPLVSILSVLVAVVALLWGIVWRQRARRVMRSPTDAPWSGPQLAAILNCVPVPCGIVATDLRWSAINDSFAQWLGLAPNQIIGHEVTRLVADGERADFRAELSSLLDGEHARIQRRLLLQVGDGEAFRCDVVAALLGSGEGCVVSLWRDPEVHGRLGSLRLTERALQAATCAMVICDAQVDDYPMVYANAAFESLSGYGVSEILGHNCRMLNAPEADQPGLEEVRAALREHRRTTVVLRNYRKDGSTFWNELTISPVFDSAGVVTHFLGMQSDVTERMEMAAEHERLLATSVADQESAGRAAKARETLLTVVSHELRSPLNAIRLWTSLLQSSDSVDADLVRRAVAQIDNAVTAQSRIIEDLLDVSRFESGRLELQRTVMELVALVREVTDRNEPLAVDRGVSLEFESTDHEASVHADRGRLDQVLQNLLDNAIKFTPRGGQVRVSVALLETRVRVVVRDSGEGLAPDKLPDIFAQFWQAEHRDTRAHGGLGLGLNLVKQIVESHDGAVDAHSDGLGKGASIAFELPLVSTGKQAAVMAQPVAAVGERIEGDILVVDDDQTTVEVVAIGLRMRGYAVRVAADVPAALAQIQERRPRILISDLMMAGRSGFDLVEDVRREEFERGLDRLPAIAITGRGSPSDRRAVRASGFDRYLQKPVRMEALVDTMTGLIDAARSTVGAEVLVVSVDRDTGEQLRAALAKHGHQVQVASSAADALALAHDNAPEVLVTELELPDGSGESLLDSIYNENSSTMTVLFDAASEASERDDRHARLAPGDTDGLLRLLARWLTL
jgi:PAS domain S-box-containing protein